ncbi:MAG: hypothetical protein ACRENE_11755 [Polyangiaceae bacterium]
MIDLLGASQILLERFGSILEAPYVPGKTLFRSELCARAALSQGEAEEVCDSLERAGAIRFQRAQLSGESQDTWLLEPWRMPEGPGR